MSKPQRIVAERYRIESVLGVGAQGRTYLAHDEKDDRKIALKRLTLADALDWKAIELFEREGQVLAALDHERIPRYIEAFQVDEDDRDAFYLAQTYIEGDRLEDLVRGGERWDNAALIDFLEQMLEVLSYLGRRRPPVIHRDVKPTNILRDSSGNYHLIDFGAVQTVVSSATGASTVIGTGGFVPVEQLMGRASPTSDLYSLGATAAYLASGTHPSDMESAALRLQFRRYATLDPILAGFIEKLVEPRPADRFASAGLALKALRERSEQTGLVKALPVELEDGRIRMDYEDSAFVLRIRNRRSFDIASKTAFFMIIGGLVMSLAAFAMPILVMLGAPFILIGALVIAMNFKSSRERDVTMKDGTLRIVARSFGFKTRDSTVDVKQLVDIITEDESVKIIDAMDTYELPGLEGSRGEVASQIRAHAGLIDD